MMRICSDAVQLVDAVKPATAAVATTGIVQVCDRRQFVVAVFYICLKFVN